MISNYIKKRKDYTFIDSLLKDFQDLYLKSRGYEYDIISIGKERKQIATLLKFYKAKNPGADSEKCRKDFKKVWEQCLNINNDWLHMHMSLGIIVSKWNDIKTIIKNGNRKKIGTSKSDIERILSEKIDKRG
jgi:hypothetical protein